MQKIRNQTWFYAFSLFALDETANLKVPAVGDKDFFVDHNCKENSILPKKMNLSIKVESSAKIPSKPPYSNTQRAVKTYFAVKVAISRTEWVLVRDLKQIRALERAVTEFLRSKDVDKNSLPSIKRKIKRFMCGISAKSVKTILKPEQVENFLNDVISSVPTSFGPLREFLELDNIFRFCISDDIEALKSFSMEKLRQTRDRCEGSAIHYAIGANATKVAGYLIQEVGIFLDLKDKFNISARTLFDRSEFLEIREITHASQQEKEPISDEKGLELPNFSVPLQYLKPSEKMRYTLIVNPISGKGQSLSILHNVVIPILRLRGIKFSVLESEFSGHVQELVSKLDLSSQDAIIGLGGDGTLHEILNGLGSSKAPITSVGLIPTGSGNAICSCIGWLDPLMSTLRLAEGFFQPLDIFQASSLKMNPNGRIESDSRLGMVVAGWGFFSEVDFNSERWRWMGELRFTFLAIQKIIQGSRYPCQVFYRPHSLEISSQAHYSDPSDFFFSVSDLSVPPGWQILDGRSGEIRYLCISNGEFISQSTRNSPGANLLDGQLWICAVSSQGRISFAKTLLKMDTGNHSDVSGVKIIPAKEILVIPENPEIPMDIDGEQRPSLPTLLQVLPWKARLCC